MLYDSVFKQIVNKIDLSEYTANLSCVICVLLWAYQHWPARFITKNDILKLQCTVNSSLMLSRFR
jgi:hypothetical protein